MTTEQAYINGFVKRASQYGYNYYEAVSLLKQAKNGGMFSSLGQGFNNLKNKLTAPSKRYKQPIGPTQPGPSIGYDAPLEPKQDPMVIPPTPGAPPHIPPYQPKYNEPVQMDPISPEINEQLTGVSPSSMTPKNQWEQGLHDIMAKKPALAARKTISSEGGPTQLNIADSHARDIYQAIGSINGEYRKKNGFAYIPPKERGIRGVYNKIVNRISPPAPDPNAAHINSLQDHFKQYDPSWGDNFRVPLPASPVGNPDSLRYYNNYKNDFIPSNMHVMNFWKNQKE